MALGNYANGTGTITSFTGNANVFGSGTSFVTQLKPGSVIGNVGNVFVGYVSYVFSNTSLLLSANANLALSNTSFHYRAVTPNAYTYTYYTTGNITSNIYSKTVTGIGTKFTTDLSYGKQLWVANSGIGPNSYVGTVELVTSDTSVYINANAQANIANLQYYTTPVTFATSIFGSGKAFNEPNLFAGLSLINTQLFNWVRSGLLANVSIVNNYHPPIQDSVTGVLVNLPASIYTRTGNLANANTYYSIGSSIRAAFADYIIQDFDTNQSALGTDLSYVHDGLHNGGELKFAVLNTPPQLYIPPVDLIPPTAADSATKFVGGNAIPRVTDDYKTAFQYFSANSPLKQLQDNPDTNLAINQNDSLRPQPIALKKLVSTGAPISIPGLLNALADTYYPNGVAWTPPTFHKTNVS